MVDDTRVCRPITLNPSVHKELANVVVSDVLKCPDIVLAKVKSNRLFVPPNGVRAVPSNQPRIVAELLQQNLYVMHDVVPVVQPF